VSKKEKIILYDSPEAARLLTPEDLIKTPVWVSNPAFWPQVITPNESTARRAGCTHKICPETGEVFVKGYSHGPTVRARRERERYNNLRQVEVTGDTVLSFFDGEEVYDGEDELFEALVEQDADCIGMVTVGVPVKFRALTTEYWADDLPDGDDIDGQALDLIHQLNAELGKRIACYALDKARPTDEFLEGLKARYDEYRKE